MHSKPLIILVVIFLVAASICSQSAVFDLKASPKIGGTFNAPPTDEGTASRDMGPSTCTKVTGGTIGTVECCATDLKTTERWCTTCDATNPPSNCTPPELQFHGSTTGSGVFEAQPLPPSNTTVPQGGGGTFEAQQAPVTPGDTGNPKIAGGFNTLPPPTGSPPPPAIEGTQAPTLTEEPAPPDCLEGQVLDEESGLCVLEEPEQSQPEEQEQQPSEEGDGSDDGNNDNDN